MDPITIGAAAAVLLATKFSEEFAKGAGASTWNTVKRLRELMMTKFRDHSAGQAAIAKLADAPSEENLTIVAEYVDEAVRLDPAFAIEIQRLVDHARSEGRVPTFTAQAFDHARQINVAGDHSGPITLS